MMTLKKRLLEDKYKFIPNFDFTVELSMRDECMLNYLIDVANYFDISLEDEELKYISNESFILTIKTIFENFSLIEKEKIILIYI